MDEQNRTEQQETQRREQPEYQKKTYYGSIPPYQPGQKKKESPAKPKRSSGFDNLGVFAVKAVIASAIAAVFFTCGAVTTIKVTGIDRSLASIADSRQMIDRENNDITEGNDYYGENNENRPDNQGPSDPGTGNETQEGDQGASESDTAEVEYDGPLLGIVVSTVTDEMMEQGYPAGVLIQEIDPDGDAAAAGLQVGDVITAFDGTVVKSNSELSQLVRSSKFGKSVKVVYKRTGDGNYTAMETTVTFTEKEETTEESEESAGAAEDATKETEESSPENTESDENN